MPTPVQWLLFLLCGVLGSAAHYCLTRSYAAADISATQSVKFLDLVWATLIGWLAFGDVASQLDAGRRRGDLRLHALDRRREAPVSLSQLWRKSKAGAFASPADG
jgi:hypothetical protein